jgi:hypothetical protein
MSSLRYGRTPFRSLTYETRLAVQDTLVMDDRREALSGWLAVE